MDKDEIREKSLQVMVSPSLQEEVERVALEENRSVSNWCRIVIEEKLNELREHQE